jgi:hypothetical protein
MGFKVRPRGGLPILLSVLPETTPTVAYQSLNFEKDPLSVYSRRSAAGRLKGLDAP